MQDWNLADQIAGLENAGLENRLESDELRLKQPQTSTTIDVSELSQNCVGLFRGVVCGGVRRLLKGSVEEGVKCNYLLFQPNMIFRLYAS